MTVVAVSASAAMLLLLVHADLVGSAQRTADRQMELAKHELRHGATAETVKHDAPRVSLTFVALGGELVEEGPVSDSSIGSETPEGTADAVTPLQPTAGLTTAASSDSQVTVTTDKGFYTLQVNPYLTPTRTALTTIAWALLPVSLVLLVFVAGLTWHAMGRALRPVAAIRAEFAEITAHHLHHRVPVRSSGDEVALLATTMNATLDQLQGAVNRLRTFTSDASHELRGPLTTLRARLEIAMMPAQQTDWSGVVEESLSDATRLEEIVHDLLFLARLDTRQPLEGELIPLADFATRVIGELYANRPVTVIAAAPEPGGADTVFGSPSSLTRVLKNLIDNALRHAAEDVEVEVVAAGAWVLIEVRDDGPGIPEQVREHVFDRFVRLDDARTARSGGSGLGLAIARDVCVAHGGSLTAREPSPGQTGARLVVRLPTLNWAYEIPSTELAGVICMGAGEEIDQTAHGVTSHWG